MTEKQQHDRASEEEEVIVDDHESTDDDVDLADMEEHSKTKLKQLRDKLKTCEQEKLSHLEELQRVKADFLNARRRMDDERQRDAARAAVAHVETLLPLCDSFHMAMADKTAWDAAPEQWRKGVEGIYAQLQSILEQYQVRTLNPAGEVFDPQQHEALSNVPVGDPQQHNIVQSVVQQGYVMDRGGESTLIRPARVTVGEFTDNSEIAADA